MDLFSGIGGITRALGPWVRPIAYCEVDTYCQGVLLSRMRSGELPKAPIWDDVRTLQAGEFPVGAVDIVYGGFPCQDISSAGRTGRGLEGPQSGLWREMYRLINELRPSLVFIENVGAWKRWVPSVRCNLERVGYSTLSLEVSAQEVGFPFDGKRVFVAASYRYGKSTFALNAEMAGVSKFTAIDWTYWRSPASKSLGVAHGVPNRVDRLRGLGNAVVPLQAREAFKRLMGLVLERALI